MSDVTRILAALAQGNPYLFTSYDAASGGNVVNQVQRSFNGLAQLITEYQSHSGAVNVNTTPKVQYAYSEMAGGANHSRLTSITYPNGKVLTYNYSSDVDDNISRLSSLSDTSGTLESYSYLGLATVVKRGHSQPGVDLTYIDPNGSTGDAGDKYTGLDRFGRVVDQRWYKSASSTYTDRLQYGYDRDGNCLYRDNLVNPAFGELYHANGSSNGYDSLNQLQAFARGTLNAGKDTISSPSHSQSWSFDAAGNWSSLTTDGTPLSRTHNAQNEVTGVGSNTLAFDSNGNLTKDDAGQQYVYDAWNRLVAVKNSGGTTIASYKYDGLHRRIVENPGTANDLYYSDQWQVLEERQGGVSTATVQYIWSPVYVDALVLRDRSTANNGTLDERLWVQQDANWNVTALVNNSGTVVERYVYDPYGKPTFLSASWGTLSGSAYAWIYLFQGGRYDATSGLYNFRERDYHPGLGRWAQTDPLGFGAGDTNLYRYEDGDPLAYDDPLGTDPAADPPPTHRPGTPPPAPATPKPPPAGSPLGPVPQHDSTPLPGWSPTYLRPDNPYLSGLLAQSLRQTAQDLARIQRLRGEDAARDRAELLRRQRRLLEDAKAKLDQELAKVKAEIDAADQALARGRQAYQTILNRLANEGSPDLAMQWSMSEGADMLRGYQAIHDAAVEAAHKKRQAIQKQQQEIADAMRKLQ